VSSGRAILLTGATGYVGGRLLHALENNGEHVRCLARRPEAVRARSDSTEVVAGDVLDPASLRATLAGVDVAYYLVHALGATQGFEQAERAGAESFAAAAREAGVRHIVYLGGLGVGDDLSPHLASRQEVGRVLRESGVPTIELRASIVIGSGSLSFELLRALVERLPLMVTPRWVRTVSQPIAVEDVIDYLLQAIEIPLPASEVVEIGGADRVSYRKLMQEYARLRGLRRAMIPVPLLTPRLSSLWLGLVTPIYARVGRKLVESLRHETVVRGERAAEVFSVRPRGYREALVRALLNEDRELAETRWSDALSSAELGRTGGVGRPCGRVVDSRAVEVAASPSRAFEPIRRIGGRTGWYFANSLWRLRGFLDLLVGGVGLRRGRTDPETPDVGSALDFWRVEAYEPDHLLRLRAEMRVLGRAWLQFEVDGDEHRSTIRQTAIFDPVGVVGLAYWYGLRPLHSLVFGRMLAGIARRAAD
jgi:uncharacterized protein YbjT (DUF2867 family)